MRTEKPPPAASAMARFRSQVVQVRRALMAQGPVFRWSLGLGTLAVLLLCGYMAAPVPSGTVLLRGGQRFPIGDIIKVSHALDHQHIDYRVDDQSRIEVAADRLDDAKGVLAKLEIGPRSIEELDKEALVSSPLDGPDDKALRQHKGEEQILAAMIREFDGIVSAFVRINRPRSRVGIRPAASAGAGSRPTAFVYLETDGGREISHQTVQSIQNLIVGKEPDLKPDAVTVFDQKGRHYLVAGDSRYSTLSATRAREEELGQRIRDQIDWIDGVRVIVQLVAASTASPPALPAVGTVSAGAALPRETGTSVGVNTPLALEPEIDPRPGPGPEPAAAALAAGAGASPLSTNGAVPAAALPEPAGNPREVARVWVRVPSSYYITKAAPDRDPSPERLQEIVKRTESLIEVAVAHVVPPELTARGEPPDVKIDTFPDREPPGARLGSPVVKDPRRPLSWWMPAGVAVGGLIALATALVVRLLAQRGPVARQRRNAPPRPGRYRTDAAADASAGPGPAERVRELIRLDPDAAASVLHRWIGQEEALG